uniref:Uridylate-specific endoribonuclease n=1 Tax=Hucho hucho TaxID=62062 RepID=A0A4W5NAY6_9TELE
KSSHRTESLSCRELSVMVQEIWDKDINRLKPGTDYRISLQGKAGTVNADMNDASDGAGYPLFPFVDESIFKKESFLAFISLLDNNESDTGEPETVTPDEEAENHTFLDCTLRMATMKISNTVSLFSLVSRNISQITDACGERFEHVFVGETKEGRTVIGFQNWIQLYLQEKNTFQQYRQNEYTPDHMQTVNFHSHTNSSLYSFSHLRALFLSPFPFDCGLQCTTHQLSVTR